MTRLVKTNDGSATVFHAGTGEHYHSIHGAVTESRHVFVEAGLKYVLAGGKSAIRILEAGFGTGLNFLLTADHCFSNNTYLDYTGIEAYPLDESFIAQTGYEEYINRSLWEEFISGYALAQTRRVHLGSHCDLGIAVVKLEAFAAPESYDIVYYDAFSALHQPEMWSAEMLKHCTDMLVTGGVFVTYSITGNLKRILRSLNFEIQKIPGAPGKREMLRAVRLGN